MPLEAEMAFFEAHRTEWLQDHEGEFALIKESDCTFFKSDAQAYEAGIDKWGEVPMLIKQVLPEDLTEDSYSLLFGLINVQA